MKMPNELYDVLSKLQRWLPALGVFYLAISAIWGFPYGDKVNETVLAVSTLLAATLEVSTMVYLRDKENESEE